MEKFSVLLPVYSGDRIGPFKLAVESILNNTLPASELVIVRDGPVIEEIEAYLAFLEQEFLHIVVVRLLENRGIVVALNTGLTVCSFELVVRADADDINYANRFELIIGALESGYDLVGSQIDEYGDGGPSGKREVPVAQGDILRFARFRNPFNHMSVGFRKSAVLELNGYPDVYRKEDYALWIKIIGNGGRVANLPQSLVRVSGGAEMHARRGGVKYLMSEVRIAELLIRNKVQKWYLGVFVLVLRMVALSIPAGLKRYLYMAFLRS